MERVSAGNVR